MSSVTPLPDHAITEQLARAFGLAQPYRISALGNGHINTTLQLVSAKRSVVLQMLNRHVFSQTDKLIENARYIEHHLRVKQQRDDYALEIVEHLPTQDGAYCVHIENEVWRALSYIPDSYSVEVAESAEQAHIAAHAFGVFSKALTDFDATLLHPVLPDFHNLQSRLTALKDAVSSDPFKRVNGVKALLALCDNHRHLVDEFNACSLQIPLRACHNDTKINNMLFCRHRHCAKAVIDLDTCMPGYWLYDIGDMLRTGVSPEPEDSTALSDVYPRKEYFEAIAEGYIAPLSQVIAREERISFWLGARIMPFIMAVRFLTDYLNGDVYYRIDHPQHNLHRANNQFALYKAILANQTQLKAMIYK